MIYLKLLPYLKKAIIPVILLSAVFYAGWRVQGWRMDSKVSKWQTTAIEEQQKYQQALSRWAAQAAEAEAESSRITLAFTERIMAIETQPPEIITRIETITERVSEISGECKDQVGITGRLIAEMHGGVE